MGNLKKYMNNATKNVESINKEPEEVIKTKVDNYSRMSESQLMNEMQKIAMQEKNNGTLNAESLNEFYNQVSPMLTQQQRNRLKQLINTLK